MSISKQIIFSSSLVALLALFGGYMSYCNMQEMEVNADRYMAKAVGVSNSLRGVHENISSIHKWLSAPGDQEEFEMGMEVLNDFINDLSILGKAKL